MQLYQQAVCAWPDMDIIFTEQIISLTSQLVFPTKLVKSFIHIVVVTVTSTATPVSIVSEWVRVFNRRIRAAVTMRRGVNWTKTTSAADEILRCRCRAGESWLADCSRAVVQRLRSSDRRAVLVRGVPVTSRAAAFCTNCRHLNRLIVAYPVKRTSHGRIKCWNPSA